MTYIATVLNWKEETELIEAETEKELLDEISKRIPPTIPLYYTDTKGYLEAIYFPDLERWGDRNNVPKKKIDELKKGAKESWETFKKENPEYLKLFGDKK